jgi:hypothetical protein
MWRELLQPPHGRRDTAAEGDFPCHVATSDVPPAKLAELAELADFATMERICGRTGKVVHDLATAAAAEAWFRQFCKRPRPCEHAHVSLSEIPQDHANRANRLT